MRILYGCGISEFALTVEELARVSDNAVLFSGMIEQVHDAYDTVNNTWDDCDSIDGNAKCAEALRKDFETAVQALEQLRLNLVAAMGEIVSPLEPEGDEEEEEDEDDDDD